VKCNHHKQGVSLLAVGHATSFMLAISFVLCVGFDLVFPNHAMYETWQKLLPGFEWISWKSFFIGAIEAYGYGWYFALIWVPVYNFVGSREKQDHPNDG
jgi:cytochrome c biogenesis protein CcdA